MKDEVFAKKGKLRQTEKKFNEVKAKNKNIVEPLNKVKKEVEQLNVDVKEYQSEKRVYNQRKNELKAAQDKLKDVQWRHEVLFQRYELLYRERDKLGTKLEKSMLQMKQRNNFNSLLLEKMKRELHDVLKIKCDMMKNGLHKEDGGSADKDRLETKLMALHRQILMKMQVAMKRIDISDNDEKAKALICEDYPPSLHKRNELQPNNLKSIDAT